jgi:polysaccharide biosynthesis transport protein
MRQKIGAVDELLQGILVRSGKYAADPQELQGHTAALRQQLSNLAAESAALSMKLSLIGAAEDVSDLSAFAAETPEGTRLLNDLSAAEARLKELTRRSGIPKETLDQIEGGIANLRATLHQEVARVANGIELQLDMITAKETSIAAQISAIQAYFTSSDWAQLEAGRREKELYETMYENSLTQIEGIYREPTRLDLRIVSDALPPLNPSFPDYKVILVLAGTIGAFFGAGLAMFREWNRT